MLDQNAVIEQLRTSIDAFIAFSFHPFFSVVGCISTCIMLLGSVISIILFFRGILPIWYRLGVGLSKRKIAIFATNECDNIAEFVLRSNLFPRKNIIRVGSNNITIASDSNATLYLVYWPEFCDNIQRVIDMKAYSTALIVYAPHSGGPIPRDILERIDREPNSIVVQFRGRLLNDILTSIITTSI